MRNVSQTPPTAEKVLEDSRRKEAFDPDNDRSARSHQVHQAGGAIPERRDSVQGTDSGMHAGFLFSGGAFSHIQNVGAASGLDLVYSNARSYLREKNTK